MSRASLQARELERLKQEHARLDEKVQQLEGQRWLSTSNEKEMKRLKRMKLAKKDRIRVMSAEA